MWHTRTTFKGPSGSAYWPKVLLLLGVWEFTLYGLYHRKFFHYYTRDVVVVVRGGADYDRLLPNDTFINASKYSSAEDLSNYLQYVAASKERYTRYLRNKDRYASNQFTSYIAFCNVCEQLHNIEANRKTYQDYRFWTKGMCRQPSDLK